jgi:hypothetical protein
MKNLLEYNHWNNNSIKWNQGGWLLIKGKPNKEGKSHIFAAQVRNVSQLARYKTSGKEGIPVNMANLYPDFYGIVTDSSGELKAMKLISDTAYIDKWIGLKNLSVGLNKNKTLNWRETIAETSLSKVLKSNEGLLKNSDEFIIPQK